MMFTFLKAQGPRDRPVAGRGRARRDRAEASSKARERPSKIVLPIDCRVAAERRRRGSRPRSCRVDAIPADGLGVDIGPASIAAIGEALLADARTVFWNGPMGIFEMPAFAEGTLGVAHDGRAGHASAARSPWWAAATRSPRSSRRASETRSATSRPAAAPRSSSSRARPCPASPALAGAPAARRERARMSRSSPRTGR